MELSADSIKEWKFFLDHRSTTLYRRFGIETDADDLDREKKARSS